MAGSNLILVKDRIVEVLTGLLGIEGDYSHVGKHHDGAEEYFYLGEQAQGPIAPAAMAGGARFTRSEDLNFTLTIEVKKKGEETTRAAEVRAVELGTKAEEYFAGNWTLGGDIPGLLKVTVTDFDLESSIEDGNAHSRLTYTLQAESHVR